MRHSILSSDIKVLDLEITLIAYLTAYDIDSQIVPPVTGIADSSGSSAYKPVRLVLSL